MSTSSENKIRDMALELADRGMDLVRDLSESKGKGFTDGYHKYVGDLVSAINATRSSLQTALVQQALTMRASGLSSQDGLLNPVESESRRQIEQ